MSVIPADSHGYSLSHKSLPSSSSSHYQCRRIHLPLKNPVEFFLPCGLHRRSISIPHSISSPSSATSEFLQQHEMEEDEEETETGMNEPSFETSFSDLSAESDLRHFSSPELEVKELEDLPEQWRRTKIAWLCKDLPPHKPAGVLRILSAQRKWFTQEDASYITLHYTRIRENEAVYRVVHQWMIRQHRFRFDFALATKLAEYLGKDRKFTNCREMFDAIIHQVHVLSESTFHILIAAYLSAPVHGCVDEACDIYNKMIQLGGNSLWLSLHNSLFRRLINRTGGSCKHYLKQAEFIYHNLVTSELEVHKDVFAGLIWLHIYQDDIDPERIASLREEMRLARIEESRGVLLFIIRASSKVGDVEETERTWLKLHASGCSLPSQACVSNGTLCKDRAAMKSLEIFKGMKEQDAPPSDVAYHKIIEVMSNTREIEIAETLV